MTRTIHHCWRLLSATARRRWLAAIPLMAAAAILEAASAGAVYVLLRAVDDPASLSVLALPDALVPQSPRLLLVVGTVCIAAIQLVKTGLLIAALRVTSRATSESTAELSIRLLEGYLAAPLPFHLRRNPADLLYTAMRAAETVHHYVTLSVVSILAEVLVLAGIGLVLWSTAPPSSIAAVAVTIALMFALSRITQRAFHGMGSEKQRLEEAAQRTLVQALEGIKELRLRGRESFVQQRFASERREGLDAESRFQTLGGTSRLLLETAFVFGILAVVLAMAWGDPSAAGLTPILAVYAYAGFRVIPSSNRIQMHLANIRFGVAAVERVRADLDAFDAASAVRAPLDAGPPMSFESELLLQEVAYSYERSASAVLERIDLSIRRGESVGIVGETGSGKTTLLHILLGLLPPSSGRVLVDGRDIGENLRGWQSRIGYVPQLVHLVDDTLARNVAFCLPDELVDLARVREVLRHAQLESLLETLPAGVDTVLGQRGVRLSGGERQRVAIARALYDDPEVLVFDEGTSSLDSATEKELTRVLERLHGLKTLIVVAHRLTTVEACDRIVLLERGRIEAVGTFDELARTHEGFRRLAAIGAESTDGSTR